MSAREKQPLTRAGTLLRDEIAMRALEQIITSDIWEGGPREWAESAYAIADAMLHAREGTPSK